MFKIANPYFLYFFILAALILGAYILLEFHRKKQWQNFGNIELLNTLMPARSVARQRVKFALVFLSLVFVILTAARLQYASGGLTNGEKRNVEVVAVVDVSNSMLCTDIAPSRLDRAKACLSQFIDESDNSKFSLIEFAGLAVTKMPLTGDYGSAKMFVNSMSPSDISTQGTAIGQALIQAQRCFSKEENVGKSIILITDAENHEDDAVATAKKLAESGIQINVVGVGSPEGAILQMGDSILKDQNGAPVITKLDENMGTNIAKEGNGTYIRCTNTDDAVKALKEEVDKVASGNVDAKTNAVFSDQFETFAMLAFILLLVDALLMERKNHLLDKLNLFSGLKKEKK